MIGIHNTNFEANQIKRNFSTPNTSGHSNSQCSAHQTLQGEILHLNSKKTQASPSRCLDEAVKKQNKMSCDSRSESGQQEQKTSDDTQIFEEYLLRGSKWTEISKCLPGRTQNAIKNKFYGGLRKMLRKVNDLGKSKLDKFSKPIKYEALMRVLDAKEGICNLPSQLVDEAEQLKRSIIHFCQNQHFVQDEPAVIEFIHALHRFNLESRCYRLKKGLKKKPSARQEISYHQRQDLWRSSYEQLPPKTNSCHTSAQNYPIKEQYIIIDERRTKQKKIQQLPQDLFPVICEEPEAPQCNDDQLEYQACRILGIDYARSADLLSEFF